MCVQRVFHKYVCMRLLCVCCAFVVLVCACICLRALACVLRVCRMCVTRAYVLVRCVFKNVFKHVCNSSESYRVRPDSEDVVAALDAQIAVVKLLFTPAKRRPP